MRGLEDDIYEPHSRLSVELRYSFNELDLGFHLSYPLYLST